MRLALNFQRVDPDEGGAETYVVDLCHRLVGARASGRPLRRVVARGGPAAGGRAASASRPRAGRGGSGSGASPGTPRRPSRREAATTARSASSTPGTTT